MEEALPGGEAPGTCRKTRCKPYTRKKPAPITVNYRMAYVGTVSFDDAAGQELGTRRYAAAAHESPTDQVVSRMMALRSGPITAGDGGATRDSKPC